MGGFRSRGREEEAGRGCTVVIYPDFDTVLLDYDGKLVAQRKATRRRAVVTIVVVVVAVGVVQWEQQQ